MKLHDFFLALWYATIGAVSSYLVDGEFDKSTFMYFSGLLIGGLMAYWIARNEVTK